MGLLGQPNIEKLSRKGDVEGLIKALRHKSVGTRREAAEALGDLGDPGGVHPLIDALRDEEVHSWAAGALGKLGDDRAIEPLQAAMTGEASYCDGFSSNLPTRSAAPALAELGAVEALVVGLEHEDPDADHWGAARALGEIGDPRAIDPLIRGLGHESSYVRKASAEALVAFRDPRSVDALIAALSDSDSEVRAEAAASLGELGDERAVAPLEGALEAERAAFRDQTDAQSWTALRASVDASRAGDDAAAGLFMADSLRPSLEPKPRFPAEEALERIGGPKAEEALTRHREE